MSSSNIVEDPKRRIKEWLDQLKEFRLSTPFDFKDRTVVDPESHIKEVAFYLALEKHTYNDLCWKLAEKIQKKALSTPNIEEIREKAEEIFNISKTYDELCWLNAEFDILTNNE
ncbi:MAG: hypothetical protein HWN81_04205 [Candidatus Lokiarchaeota archaeon]|nr:hypothetical protein [Candidatus Lokiarchaeota archaeon]